MKADELVRELSYRREGRLEMDRKPWPRRNPVASDIHPCERYMVLAVLAWQVRPVIGTWGLCQMENGNVMEPHVLQQLQAEGWTVQRSQEHVELRGRSGAVVLTGRIDGVLQDDDGERWLFDVKDTALYTFNRLADVDDVRRNKWTAKWWTQAQAYMLGLEIPRFVWILSHRGARKYITAELDYVEAERILQSCEDAVETIRAYEAFPLDKLDAELGAPSMIVAETCRDCHFFGTACHPPLPSAESVDAVVRDDLAEDVARLVELEDAAKEHGALDRRLGKETKGKHVLAGEYLLTGEWREVHRKAQPAKPSEDVKQWKRERVKMGGET